MHSESLPIAQAALAEIRGALGRSGGPDPAADEVAFVGDGVLPSRFAVTELAAASVAAAGLALADYARPQDPARVRVDARLAGGWFDLSIRPQGWKLPPVWNALAGNYRTADGWVRLHTNAPHHRTAACAALDLPADADKPAVAATVATMTAEAVQEAVAAAGGCAAVLHHPDDWVQKHPQGRAVAREPLIAWTHGSKQRRDLPRPDPVRPLLGLRVLDLTRILAGPVATRFLAGYGAQVLRIDPMNWEEPMAAQEVTLGKHCARLDLRSDAGRETLEALLAQADVLVHGYRADALERLGLGTARRAEVAPGLVDVALNAFGWTGPWSTRRGFDSLVQMSSGLAWPPAMDADPDVAPDPLPVQALDHATGYLLAAAVLTGLSRRAETGRGQIARCSLARTAAFLRSLPPGPSGPAPAPFGDGDLDALDEVTAWGPARRLMPPLSIEGCPVIWPGPAVPLGTHAPRWP